MLVMLSDVKRLPIGQAVRVFSHIDFNELQQHPVELASGEQHALGGVLWRLGFTQHVQQRALAAVQQLAQPRQQAGRRRAAGVEQRQQELQQVSQQRLVSTRRRNGQQEPVSRCQVTSS